MDIKMKLIILIFLISVITVVGVQFGFEQKTETNHNAGSKLSNSNSRKNSKSKELNFDQSGSRQNGLEASKMSGHSRSQYKHKKYGHLKAKGKFRSRGLGRHGIVSSESTYYVIEGKFDRYGRKRPTNSKFKTRGKEKKYSKKIVDNQFDIQGGLIEERKYKRTGDYQANGTHAYIQVGAEQQASSALNVKRSENKHSDKNKEFEFKLSSNDTRKQRSEDVRA
ncbi:Trematode Eggshell Synthesis domain containing protein [Schistosoma mansoni]|uniref:Trematode Eggshell Synthesis domain containing protein n=1 Tax=Schistosoma mansoni TaxID=6183 RepID=G4LVS2_SCHMA|nr:Trematode Eggshell Synthesis domain containing protein [Schistosoma mansoni]|eukprot:XP_018645369.1 Trematode Eggshell Synthesis domain containing protein [Schistosoma mansoni]